MADEILYNYEEIINNLKNEQTEDFVKIFSIIEIEQIKDKKDFEILIYHLTNHPTPIREITAIKLEEISQKQANLFLNEFSKNRIINAIADINPNVSRAVCLIIENNPEIQDLIFDDLIKKIVELIETTKSQKIKNEQENKKSHAKNKIIFALYWYLEALSLCLKVENNAEVLEIVNFALNFYDYTIREKGAKILTKIEKPPVELLQKAKSDQNFYVKNLVYDKIDNGK